jgi:hypothetical protein
MKIDHVPYQQSRNAYYDYLHEFKDNHGYLCRNHNFDNFKKFVDHENINFVPEQNGLGDYTLENIWNWYFF